MIRTTIYYEEEMMSGECAWCGCRSNQLVEHHDEHVCIDCIEEKNFIEETMNSPQPLGGFW